MEGEAGGMGGVIQQVGGEGGSSRNVMKIKLIQTNQMNAKVNSNNSVPYACVARSEIQALASGIQQLPYHSCEVQQCSFHYKCIM